MKKIIYLLSMAFVMLQCTRNKDVEGPLLNDIYGEFAVMSEFKANTSEVDFQGNESVIFEARFNKNVDWQIEIIGQRSGARAIFEGKTFEINAQNAAWRGNATILPMFKTEPCKAILKVAAENFHDTLDVNILSTKESDAIVVADFENGINAGWTVFAQTGANMSFRIVQSDTAAQGNHYYDMGGAVGWDYLIGLLDFPRTAYPDQTFGLPANPNNLYFNVFLYKPSNITNEIVLIRFMEDENEDGAFTEANEDMYAIELKGLKAGWQQVSVKYSDLVTLVNGLPGTPAGNGVKDPNKLFQVSVLFLADPATGYSQTLIDNMVFTVNEPFQP